MTTCRLCDANLSMTFVDLGMSPLSNGYLTQDQLLVMEPFYPLRVFICERCLLVQLPELELAANIFGSDYRYFSSYSDSWLRHCEAHANAVIERFGLGADSLVLEIASNDGYLLQYFASAGVPVLGVEPAANVAKAAEARGIPTRVEFFNAQSARQLVAEGKRPALIVANNVLAHVPSISSFIEGIGILLASGGVATFEFPHLVELVENVQFDTIYHEHFSYFTLHTAQLAFAKHGLEIFDVDQLTTHGGSLRLYVRRQGAGPDVAQSVSQLRARERAGGYHELSQYLRFQAQVDRVKRDLLEFLITQKREGKRTVGYGAPAKGNTLLNYCGIRGDLIDFTVDKSPHKQGLFLPGTHLPIHEPDYLLEARPDYVLILPWNLRDEIMEQLAVVRDWGCHFVVPIPKLEVS